MREKKIQSPSQYFLGGRRGHGVCAPSIIRGGGGGVIKEENVFRLTGGMAKSRYTLIKAYITEEAMADIYCYILYYLPSVIRTHFVALHVDLISSYRGSSANTCSYLY